MGRGGGLEEIRRKGGYKGRKTKSKKKRKQQEKSEGKKQGKNGKSETEKKNNPHAILTKIFLEHTEEHCGKGRQKIATKKNKKKLNQGHIYIYIYI